MTASALFSSELQPAVPKAFPLARRSSSTNIRSQPKRLTRSLQAPVRQPCPVVNSRAPNQLRTATDRSIAARHHPMRTYPMTKRILPLAASGFLNSPEYVFRAVNSDIGMGVLVEARYQPDSHSRTVRLPGSIQPAYPRSTRPLGRPDRGPGRPSERPRMNARGTARWRAERISSHQPGSGGRYSRSQQLTCPAPCEPWNPGTDDRLPWTATHHARSRAQAPAASGLKPAFTSVQRCDREP